MILDYFRNFPSPWNVLVWIGLFFLVFGVCVLLTKLSNLIFRRIQSRHPGLHVMFLHHIITIVIIIGFVVLVLSTLAGVQTVWTTLFGGTAIISAVLAFAAQDIIKDVLAGMMISANNPFKVGDRISLDDGTTGVVEDITLHHVVIRGAESLRYIIPNSKMNSMRLTNYNFKETTRSAVFKFSVGYDSDMALVKKVIANAVERSPYSIMGYVGKDGQNHYGDVYFMSFADSALIMQVTVYYSPTISSEKVIDDINVRVREALNENGVEIPYNYVNVVEKPGDKAPAKKLEKKAEKKPEKQVTKKEEKAPAKKEEKAPVKAPAPATEKPVTKAPKAPVAKSSAAKSPAVKAPTQAKAKPDVKADKKAPAKPAAKSPSKPTKKAPGKNSK